MASDKEFWEAYRDPRWQQKRLEVMQAAGFRCQDCDDETKTLNVHHRHYIKGRKPWEYAGDELICLCEDCHKTRHESLNEVKAYAGKLEVDQLNALAGYAKALYLSFAGGKDQCELITVKDYDDAQAVANVYWLQGNEPIIEIVRICDERGGIDHDTLQAMWREQVAASRPLPDLDQLLIATTG